MLIGAVDRQLVTGFVIVLVIGENHSHDADDDGDGQQPLFNGAGFKSIMVKAFYD